MTLMECCKPFNSLMLCSAKVNRLACVTSKRWLCCIARLYSKSSTASTMTVNRDAWLPYFRVRRLNAWRSVRRGTAGRVGSGGWFILLPSPTCRFYRAQREKQAEHGKQHKIGHVLCFDDALGKIFLVLGK